jgi:hypothetical protein
VALFSVDVASPDGRSELAILDLLRDPGTHYAAMKDLARRLGAFGATASNRREVRDGARCDGDSE